MPLLYGEGAKRHFNRLQTEIMKISDDGSLSAWTSNQGGSGLFAAHPRYFATGGDSFMDTHSVGAVRPPFSMTNKGLKIAVPENHLQPSLQNNGAIRFCLRCSRGYTENAQIHGKSSLRGARCELGAKVRGSDQLRTLKGSQHLNRQERVPYRSIEE